MIAKPNRQRICCDLAKKPLSQYWMPFPVTFSGLPLNEAFWASNLSLTYFLVMSKTGWSIFFLISEAAWSLGCRIMFIRPLASAFSHQTSHIIKCMHAHNKTFLLGEKIRERARVLEMARDLFISKEEEHHPRSASRLQVRGVCGHKIGSLRLWLCLYSFSCLYCYWHAFPPLVYAAFSCKNPGFEQYYCRMFLRDTGRIILAVKKHTRILECAPFGRKFVLFRDNINAWIPGFKWSVLLLQAGKK